MTDQAMNSEGADPNQPLEQPIQESQISNPDDSTWGEVDEQPHYETVDDAIEAIRNQREAQAEVENYIQNEELSNEARKSRSEAFSPSADELHTSHQIEHAQMQWAQDAQAYQSAIQQIDMDKLKRDNPGQWTYLRQEMEEIEKELVTRHSQIAQAYSQTEQNYGKRVLESERQKMIEKAPELADPNVQAELRDYLLKQGFTKEEIEGTADHRLILANYRAMKQEKQDSRQGKVIPLKKSGKPKLPPKAAKFRQRFEESGSISDYFSYLDAASEAGIKVQLS